MLIHLIVYSYIWVKELSLSSITVKWIIYEFPCMAQLKLIINLFMVLNKFIITVKPLTTVQIFCRQLFVRSKFTRPCLELNLWSKNRDVLWYIFALCGWYIQVLYVVFNLYVKMLYKNWWTNDLEKYIDKSILKCKEIVNHNENCTELR